MGAANTIEINGKVYDARTGKPIGSDEKKIVKSAVKKRTKQAAAVGTIDGFRAPKKTSQSAHVTQQSAPAKKATRSTLSTMKRRPKQSVTLHRGIVQQPSKNTVAATKTVSKPAVHSSALKAALNPEYERAKKIQKSPLISRFRSPVQQESAHTKAASGSNDTSPKKDVGNEKKQAPPLQTALAHAASAHEMPGKKKKVAKRSRTKTKVAGIGSTILAGCLIVAYVAYLNIPDISMRVAAQRAGFAATLPSYRPTGYSFRGPIESHPGQVTINFQASNGERTFSLSQQETTWDSTALLENYVAKHTAQYVTYQDRGLTIYIYDGSNAAWVNAGKMYNINAENVQLDTDQLLKLATSM